MFSREAWVKRVQYRRWLKSMIQLVKWPKSTNFSYSTTSMINQINYTFKAFTPSVQQSYLNNSSHPTPTQRLIKMTMMLPKSNTIQILLRRSKKQVSRLAISKWIEIRRNKINITLGYMRVVLVNREWEWWLFPLIKISSTSHQSTQSMTKSKIWNSQATLT